MAEGRPIKYLLPELEHYIYKALCAKMKMKLERVILGGSKKGISAGGQVDRACIVAVLRKRLTPKRFRHSPGGLAWPGPQYGVGKIGLFGRTST